MSKSHIRSPLLITAAMALAPALAFAADTKPKQTTTTTTTTTSPQGSTTTAAPGGTTGQGTQGTANQGSAVLSPTTPPDMRETDAMNRSANPNMDPSGIDPAQVQKVFGMDVALIDLKSLNKDQVQQLQQRLQERGFYRGKIDGAMGPQTRNALTGLMAQQYALNQRLVNQGQVTEQFATSLGLDTRGRTPVTGVDQTMPSPVPMPPPAQHGNAPAPRTNAPAPAPAPTPPPNQ